MKSNKRHKLKKEGHVRKQNCLKWIKNVWSHDRYLPFVLILVVPFLGAIFAPGGGRCYTYHLRILNAHS